MATELEVLKVRLEAMTAKYNKQMADAAKKTKRSTGKIDKAMKALVLRFVGFAAVVMTARKAYHAFTASMRRVDALAKAADKLGMTTEALAGLQHAAKITGIEQNTLNMALQRMTRRVAEAGQGMGEAQGALKELGLEAKAMTRLAPDKMFMRIAGAIKDVESPADRLRLAFKLFDSEGAELVRTLELGEGGLRGMTAEAKRFGLAVTRDAARGVEKANDEITRLKAQLEGLSTQLVTKAAPAIKGWASGMQIIIDRIKQASILADDMQEDFHDMTGPEEQEWLKEWAGEWEAAGVTIGSVAEKWPERLEAYALYIKESERLRQAEVDGEKAKQEKINTWTQQGIAQREAWEKMSNAVRVQTTIGGLSAMAAAWGEQSRTMFEWSKGLAMAEALMNVAQGITAAWKLPPPYNAIQAGIIAATGAAQIANISATQFQKGGGGGGAAPAAGGGGAGAAAAAPAQTPLDVSISMQGSRFSDAEVRELIGAIDGQLADGVQMRSLRVS